MKKMNTKEILSRVDELANELDEEIYKIDDMDAAIVGTHVTEQGNTVLVYDRNKCIDCLAKQFTKECNDDEDPYEMAEEWFVYNTIRSLPYLHEKAPIIVERF